MVKERRPLSGRAWRLRALASIFAGLPLGFGLIRAISTRSDLRYVWVALAALLGAGTVIAAGGANRGRPLVAMGLAAAAFVASTVLAMLAAMFLGTKPGMGMLVVTSAFGLCCAACCLFYTLADATEG